MIWEEFYFSAPQFTRPDGRGGFTFHPDVPFPVKGDRKLFTLTPTLFMWHIISPEGTESAFNAWRDVAANKIGWKKFDRPNLSGTISGNIFDKLMNAMEAQSTFVLGAGENEYYVVADEDEITGAPVLSGVSPAFIKQWKQLLPFGRWGMIFWHIASTATLTQFNNWRDINAGKVGYAEGERPSISDTLKKKALNRIMNGIMSSHEFGGHGIETPV